ncbi:hypothetical protein HC031_32265 [Planosporangium thailandense]|uniref:Uncharacterized protein n=1 Tax=Planosporangium thailandense TaxID=765197 RepID=A0ABX0Y7M1_9ACTN|nr:hypothetical protein [Planosporangium thailandense]
MEHAAAVCELDGDREGEHAAEEADSDDQADDRIPKAGPCGTGRPGATRAAGR